MQDVFCRRLGDTSNTTRWSLPCYVLFSHLFAWWSFRWFAMCEMWLPSNLKLETHSLGCADSSLVPLQGLNP